MRKRVIEDPDDCGEVIIFDPKDGRILQGTYPEDRPRKKEDIHFPPVTQTVNADMVIQELEVELQTGFHEVLADLKEAGAGAPDEKGEFPSRKNQFKPGQSGNPGGKRAPLITSFMRTLLEVDADGRVLKIVAAAWLRQCVLGNKTALKELLDRVDGPPSRLPLPPARMIDPEDELEFPSEENQPKKRVRRYVSKEECETSRIDEYEAGLID